MNFFDFKKGEIILIDKKPGWTSFDVVNKIKFFLKNFDPELTKLKIGHCGTLDPFATGLLVILTGSLTKEIPKFQDSLKTYCGLIEFGKETHSLDTETEIYKEKSFNHITPEQIKNNVKNFVGKIWQTPPIYSALKLNGKRFCDHIRKNENNIKNKINIEQEILKKTREVEIFEFEILEINMPFVSFMVKCSKGTYIRSLASDFAKSLDSIAYLKELRRIKVGDFSVENSKDVESFLKTCL